MNGLVSSIKDLNLSLMGSVMTMMLVEVEPSLGLVGLNPWK